MFKLFTGKLSSIFTTVYQGLSQAVGDTLTYVAGIVDIATSTIEEITSPITDELAQLPIIGSSLESTLDTVNNAISDATDTIQNVGSNLSEGNLPGAVDYLLDQATGLVGGSLNDVSEIIGEIGDIVDPITGQPLADLPILGNILTATGTTVDNASGLVNEIGDYIDAIDPVDLLSQLENAPLATVGGLVQDVSGILDNILDDVSPITDLTSDLPVVGHVVDGLGYIAQHTINGLGFLGEHISQIPTWNSDNSSWWS